MELPGMSFPPGYRFHPTDEELVDYYLKPKVRDLRNDPDIIPVVDNLYKCEPWELPEKSFMAITHRQEFEWYLFGPRDRKYPNGSNTNNRSKMNRATLKGHWKSTGNDRTVRQHNSSAIIAMKKTLVYHKGRAPHGKRTEWIMHEYRLDIKNTQPFSYGLYRLFRKKENGTETTQEAIPLSSPPPSELTAAAAGGDTDMGIGGNWSCMNDQLTPSTAPAGGCSGADAVVISDTDKGNGGNCSWIDGQLNVFDNCSYSVSQLLDYDLYDDAAAAVDTDKGNVDAECRWADTLLNISPCDDAAAAVDTDKGNVDAECRWADTLLNISPCDDAGC